MYLHFSKIYSTLNVASTQHSLVYTVSFIFQRLFYKTSFDCLWIKFRQSQFYKYIQYNIYSFLWGLSDSVLYDYNQWASLQKPCVFIQLVSQALKVFFWFFNRYQGQVGFAPAAYLQRYHGAVINNEVTTGAQVVSTIKDAISSNGNESGSWKPVDSAHKTASKSTTLKSPEPTSPRSPEPASWKTLDTPRVTSPTIPKSPQLPKKLSDTVLSPTPKSSEDKSVTNSKPVSPKPFVQKFAPTWHSMQQPYIDKERELAHDFWWSKYSKLCLNLSPHSNLCSHSKNLTSCKCCFSASL